jgi:membrane protein implicated in regulation of membrane protease activity
MDFWFILAVVLICIEIFAGFTIFASIFAVAALTIGCLIYFFPEAFGSLMIQIAAYCAAVAFWSLILWKPLKLLLKQPQNNGEYINIVGQKGEVIGADLKPGHIGKISWSGTQVKAMIDKIHHKDKKIEVGTTVTITGINNNIFTVKQK